MNATNASIRVFVTHKSDDLETAKNFTQILQCYDPEGRLKFDFAEDMPVGEYFFQQWIYERVVQADVLFFLMISPTQSWEWCIYEAGLFAGSNYQQLNRRIIIFFNPSQHTLPSPLRNLQAVKTDQSNVQTFLQQFYGTPDLIGVEPPLNSHFAENLSTIRKVARDICSLLTNNNGV